MAEAGFSYEVGTAVTLVNDTHRVEYRIEDILVVTAGRYYLVEGGGMAYYVLEDDVVPVAPVKTEAPCPLRGCGRPNDIGAKICWSCGNALSN